MSNIDKRALREAAERAGQNDWEYVYTSDLSAPGRGYITVGGAEAIYCLNKAAGGVKQSENVLRYIAAANPATVLALLDELETKDSMIAAQQHEIRTLLNALEGRPCPKCNDTGMADSGGTQPWGEPISVPCDCAAPPAPVSVPAAMEMDDDFDSAFEHGKAVGWNACRAAMLQSFGNSEQLNSPVIPDGWVMVPVEPTEDMIVNGFESEPDESFSDEKEWKAYDAMSGCQQAAHRAKLCWAAMIEAAPKLE